MLLTAELLSDGMFIANHRRLYFAITAIIAEITVKVAKGSMLLRLTITDLMRLRESS
jgi:hypothetical protein